MAAVSTPDDIDKAGHWGLKGLFERGQRLGGQLRLDSPIGQGTHIHLVIPAYRAYRGYSKLQFLLRALH